MNAHGARLARSGRDALKAAGIGGLQRLALVSRMTWAQNSQFMFNHLFY
jgi:hypothetical protein